MNELEERVEINRIILPENYYASVGGNSEKHWDIDRYPAANSEQNLSESLDLKSKFY